MAYRIAVFLSVLVLAGCGTAQKLGLAPASIVGSDTTSGGFDDPCGSAFTATGAVVGSGNQIVTDHEVEFEVQASGCTGLYLLDGSVEPPFSTNKKIRKSYAVAGAQTLNFTIHAVDFYGRRIASRTISPIRFNVIPPRDNPNPCQNDPTCTVLDGFRMPSFSSSPPSSGAGFLLASQADQSAPSVGSQVAPTDIVQVVVSFLLDFDGSIEITRNRLILYSGNAYAARDLQIAIKTANGTETMVVDIAKPFGDVEQINRSRTFILNGNFSALLSQMNDPYAVTVRNRIIGARQFHLDGSPITYGSNDGGLTNLSYVAGESLRFGGTHWSKGGGYYQAEFCRRGFQCR